MQAVNVSACMKKCAQGLTVWVFIRSLSNKDKEKQPDINDVLSANQQHIVQL